MHVEIRAGTAARSLPPQHLQRTAVKKSPPTPPSQAPRLIGMCLCRERWPRVRTLRCRTTLPLGSGSTGR